MIFTIEEILNHPSRCEDWNDKRTIKFMNSEPNIMPGQKTLRNFIDSVGNNHITYDDIFFCTINHINDRDTLFNFCINLIEYINTLNKNNNIKNKIDSLKNYKEVPKTKSFLKNSKNNMIDNIKNKIEIKKDIDTEVRILKVITKILDGYFINNTNMIDETLKCIRVINKEYDEINYLFILNRLEEFINEQENNPI